MSRVFVDAGCLARVAEMARDVAPAHRYAVISDETVAPLYAPAVARGFGGSAALLTIPAGEAHKSRETWMMLTDALLDGGFGRDTTIIALGGGVVGDIAGFVAATYMRGIPVIQVPTTLLAMVDASIGGKTAVDTPHGKNLVGAFHPPAAVIVDPETLATLPVDHLRLGSAEIIKHGIIADERYFVECGAIIPSILNAREQAADYWLPLIARSVEIKRSVVDADPRERGRRKVLNFGHTIGHAVELASDWAVPHGAAVSIGMTYEARIAEGLGIAEPGTAMRVEEAVTRLGLAATLPEWLDPSRVVEATRMDKKGRAGAVEYALPLRIGEMCPMNEWAVPVEDGVVLDVLRR